MLCLACVLLLMTLTSSALAESQALSLPWWTVDSGGKIDGGNFTLYSAIGQADAASMSGGTFKLTGGFLAGQVGKALQNKLFLPLIVKH